MWRLPVAQHGDGVLGGIEHRGKATTLASRLKLRANGHRRTPSKPEGPQKRPRVAPGRHKDALARERDAPIAHSRRHHKTLRLNILENAPEHGERKHHKDKNEP